VNGLVDDVIEVGGAGEGLADGRRAAQGCEKERDSGKTVEKSQGVTCLIFAQQSRGGGGREGGEE
jgi:hypothetical protein